MQTKTHPGTLSAWFVGILLLVALLFCMSMLSSIQQLDRFDDPKGPQLIINTKGNAE